MAVHDPDDFALVDNFDRGNQTPPGPLWQTGPNIWTDNSGGLSTTSNELASSGGGYRDAHLLASYARPVAVRFRIAATGSDGGVSWLWLPDVIGTTSPAGYALYVAWASGNDQIELQRYSSGAATLLGSAVTTIALAVNDVLTLIVDSDDSVHIWHKPAAGAHTKLVEVTDSGGSKRPGPFYPGVETNSTSLRLDDMHAGAPVAAATAPPPRSFYRRFQHLLTR